jgi:hypothetical protein
VSLLSYQYLFIGGRETAQAMVLQYLLPALIGFAFVMGAAYAGTLRALEVYFDPDRQSIFLSDDYEPPNGE